MKTLWFNQSLVKFYTRHDDHTRLLVKGKDIDVIQKQLIYFDKNLESFWSLCKMKKCLPLILNLAEMKQLYIINQLVST